jgi:hypothetical protein
MDRHFFPNIPTQYYSANIFLNCESGPSFINLDQYLVQRLAFIPSCSVDIINVSYNSSADSITATVKANFTSADSGDIRLNLFLTEDSLLTHYEQLNDVTGTYFPDWYQNHIIRSIQGGPWGTPGIIPAKVTSGSSYSKTYSFKDSSIYNSKYLNLIGIVQKYDTAFKQREVINCFIGRLGSFLTATDIASQPMESFEINVNPSPVIENCTIDLLIKKQEKILIEAYNTLGEKMDVIMNRDLALGHHSILWTPRLPNGIYYIVTSANEIKTVKKVILAK